MWIWFIVAAVVVIFIGLMAGLNVSKLPPTAAPEKNISVLATKTPMPAAKPADSSTSATNCNTSLTNANEYIDRASKEVEERNYDCAIADYTQALQLDPQNFIVSHRLCWLGSLSGKASEVMDACDKAVELETTGSASRLYRGIARALTGNSAGAIGDFKSWVEWIKQNGFDNKNVAEVERWITELRAGHNPFDEATLEKLRKGE